MADIRKEIKFTVDIASLQESMRQIGPMLKQLEDQIRLNIPIRPSIVDPQGRPITAGGMAGAMPDVGGLSMAQMKQSPAFQYLQMQEALRARMPGGDRPTTGILEDRLARSKETGRMIDITAMEKLVSHSKELDERFVKLSEVIDRLNGKTEKLTDDELKDAATAKKEMHEIRQQESELRRQAGGDATGRSGGGPISALVAGSVAGSIVRAIQIGVGIPLEQMQARAAMARVGGRDIAAMGGMDFTSMARMDPNIRQQAEWGRLSGMAGGLFGGATLPMAAAGAAAGAGFLGIGAIPGALIGGGLGIGIQALRGAPQRGGAMGFEAGLEAATGMRAREAEFFGAGANALRRAFPLRAATGLTEDQMTTIYGPQTRAAMIATGFTSTELYSGVGAATGMGLGGGAAMNQQMRLGVLARQMGVSAEQVAQMGVGMTGQLGASGNMERLTRAVHEGTKSGYREAALSMPYMQARSTIMGGLGGGMGAIGEGQAGMLLSAATSAFGGASAAAPGAAATMADMIQERQRAMTGPEAMGTLTALETVSRQNPAFGKFLRGLKPGTQINLIQSIMKGGPAIFESPAMQKAMKSLGFRGDFKSLERQFGGEQQYQQVMGTTLTGQLAGEGAREAFRMGEYDPDASLSLIAQDAGRFGAGGGAAADIEYALRGEYLGRGRGRRVKPGQGGAFQPGFAGGERVKQEAVELLLAEAGGTAIAAVAMQKQMNTLQEQAIAIGNALNKEMGLSATNVKTLGEAAGSTAKAFLTMLEAITNSPQAKAILTQQEQQKQAEEARQRKIAADIKKQFESKGYVGPFGLGSQ